MRIRFTLAIWFLAALITSGPARADDAKPGVHVAVAANFTGPAKQIAEAFEHETGHPVLLSFGSTGKLFTQIHHGAPFEVFLAADQTRPERAQVNGLAVAGSRFTYAEGRIVLYSRDPEFLASGIDVLTTDRFRKLAIANPKTAPYGAAAMEALAALGVLDHVRPRLVQGDNIAQTYQFVATGNAELAFVAAAQVAGTNQGSRWAVPNDLHSPIRQDAVLLKAGKENTAAQDFFDFLKSPRAQAIIAAFGYGVP